MINLDRSPIVHLALLVVDLAEFAVVGRLVLNKALVTPSLAQDFAFLDL
jgi:hypothetical protein